MTIAPPTATTSAPTRSMRSVVIGIAALIVVAIVAIVVFAATRPPARGDNFLSPTSGSPEGARALVQVLGDQGVTVASATTLAEVLDATDDPDNTTIVVYDYYQLLGSEQRQTLLHQAHRIVVLDPSDDELADYAPGVVLEPSGTSGRIPTDCMLFAAKQARAVTISSYGYDVSNADNDVLGCYQYAADTYAAVQTTTQGDQVTLVGFSQSFTNGSILESGNAAFALNILGEDPNLVWYLPGFSDYDAGAGATNARNLTPPWLTPLLILGGVLLLAVAFWRARRFGPLVAEKLPVIVRSNETMEGRARLYERAGARGHALDSLRIGTIARLATVCGLPRRSTVNDVVDTVAALVRRPRAEVAGLLIDAVPATDTALVNLSDELLRLEAEVIKIARS
ncbi:MAG: DUF4350 domain-containing protein [Pseudolysinimonas sp.]|uniref:DUF4350 domain-containing protein n=1 Tax=Pseudolysinimonas sp. TaxID=2680009 RepID=UPI003263BF5E